MLKIVIILIIISYLSKIGVQVVPIQNNLRNNVLTNIEITIRAQKNEANKGILVMKVSITCTCICGYL